MIPASVALPETTFPNHKSNDPKSEKDLLDSIRDEILPILILSDFEECNSNFSIVLKTIVDFLATQRQLYHLCSKLALSVLKLNLFIKNYTFCIGKLLSLLDIISQPDASNCDESTQTLELFILVLFLLMLKLTTEQRKLQKVIACVEPEQLLATLQDLDFIGIISRSISRKAQQTDHNRETYVSLKFDCDIIFQYLYGVGILTEDRFEIISSSNLIPNVVNDLLSSVNLIDYNAQGGDVDDTKYLVSYEEFKLILLLNEQYMMRALTTSNFVNTVFETLCVEKVNRANGICAFTNVLVYFMNREESHVIKILMLKFLYLVFTSSYSARLAYLNDLKILVDIIIRELNDLNYCSDDEDSSLLAMTYMKILYPLLKFSQLNDLDPAYKPTELRNVLSYIILNCESALSCSTDTTTNTHAQVMVKTAIKLLSIPFLNEIKPNDRVYKKEAKAGMKGLILPYTKVAKLSPAKIVHSMTLSNDSSDSVGSVSSSSSPIDRVRLQSTDTSSTESFSLARVSSVRATMINNFYQPQGTTNASKCIDSQDCTYVIDNFLEKEVGRMDISDLDSEPKYTPPPSPVSRRRESTQLSTSLKAKQKKAPPPPPPHPRNRRSI